MFGWVNTLLGRSTAPYASQGETPAPSEKALPAGLLALPWQQQRALGLPGSTPDLNKHVRGWVYAAIRVVAQACSAADLSFSVRSGSPPTAGRCAGWRRERTSQQAVPQEAAQSPGAVRSSHPVIALLDWVNPRDTYVDLMQTTVTDLEISGNAYWMLCRGAVSRVPVEIWPLPPAWVRVVPGDGGAAGYEIKRGAKTIPVASQDIVHFKYPNPASQWYGMGPLEAALDSVYADEAVARAQRRTFENGPLPGVVLKTKEELTPDQQKRLRVQFESMYRGPEMAGRMIISHGDTEVTPFTSSPREMDFVHSAQATRDRILGVFGVPPAVLGLIEIKNETAVKAAQMLFARDTVAPKLRLLAAHITQGLCSQFLPDGLRAAFRSPVPEDREADRKDAVDLTKAEVFSVDEVRRDIYGKGPKGEEGNE